MRILVTGANGFIGRWAVKILKEQGHELYAFDRHLNADESRDGINYLSADLLALDDTSKKIESVKAQGLIHFAWDTTHGVYWDTPRNLNWTTATLSMLDSFVRAGGKRAVIAGTCAEYLWGSDAPLTEYVSPLGSKTLYGTSKNALREIVEAWAPQVGLSCAWGRIFCPYGPYEKAERLIPKVILKLLAGESIDFDSGSSIRDFIHVEDLGAAFVSLFHSEVGGAVNIASGTPVTIREVISEIGNALNALDRIRFDIKPAPDNEIPFVVADAKRLFEEVGWRSEKTLSTRIMETCAWWQKHLKS